MWPTAESNLAVGDGKGQGKKICGGCGPTRKRKKRKLDQNDLLVKVMNKIF